ncbi:solute carrier family 22 member 6-A isoform X2 [Plectropomus leopardus]|uniref:solute carrier family 22 member 6-A isoform X2 n=1 Tax=Plectropomus leopardus TaxID=160734 RepID=UPI001C4D5F97|nr:solute carrier family 22 member 6-A isoform X2 [Plectropomus leopardus]
MGFSDLLDEVGGFGRYQWIHVTLISLPGLLMASQNLLNNFVSGIPAHHCRLPANHSLHNLSHYQVDQKQLLKAYIPLDSSGSRLDRCRRYVEPQWQLLAANGSSANVSQLQTEGCLDGWTFDTSEFLATTVSEWELVCPLRPLKQMIQTIYMGGVLAGAIIYGGLSDRFGRRSVLIWSYLQLAILGCSSALSPSYSAYCIFRFLSGMAVSGIILNGVSLKVEWIPTRERTLVGTLSSFFFTFGQMILAGLSYWLRDWRKLQVAVCAPQFLFFAWSWWYSESARWSVLNGRSEEALKSLHRIARVNGKPEVIDKLTLEVLHSHMSKEIESSRSSLTAYDLLRTRGMRRISVCLLVVWFSTSFAYYGLAMDLQKFGVSHHLLTCPPVPVHLSTCLSVRVSWCPPVDLSNCLRIREYLPDADHLWSRGYSRQAAGSGHAQLPGQEGHSGHLSLHVCPRHFRQYLRPHRPAERQDHTGLSWQSVHLVFLHHRLPVHWRALPHRHQVFPALPSVVYGGAAVLASCFACFLPETLNIPLPDTIEDVEEKWSGSSPTPRPEEGVSLKRDGESCDEGVVSTEGVALKELKEAEGVGLNAL